ncbi:uncharacterized protein LOC113374091 [Ctenocephalides felis]|uniref:uncharacterized protein LOC113374091 n=1 Tax=Ctenocephalides felis TaxID=7515 RepID=UPI000E6E10EF|nr:uncharacterized protein LOC113374091 [Ctenocephalides felis]
MPNTCQNRHNNGVRDANNNNSINDMYNRIGSNPGSNSSPKVTAKVMFGTVEALRDLRLKEQMQRQQKK